MTRIQPPLDGMRFMHVAIHFIVSANLHVVPCHAHYLRDLPGCRRSEERHLPRGSSLCQVGVTITPHSLWVDDEELGLTLTVQLTNGSLDLGGGGVLM